MSDEITLRDTFAAAAMTGIIAASDDSEIKEPQAEFLSRQAWLVADAMLRQRALSLQKRPDNPPARPGDGTGDTPTLTDAEREALEWAIEIADSLAECSGAGTGGEPSREAATLRALLARLGGDA